MDFDAERILQILDDCAENGTFPMLDNAYVYLAATRLSLFRSASDWAMVIETFGYCPGHGEPDLVVATFASRLRDRKRPEDYVTPEAFQNDLARHRHDESKSFHPFSADAWSEEDYEMVAADASTVTLRGEVFRLPEHVEYDRLGIGLEEPPGVHVAEFCRYIAHVARDLVLATPKERRVSVLPEMRQILQLEEWRHPDLAGAERPSEIQDFRQLAQVLATGNLSHYRPTEPPNTHWSHWPAGGSS